METGNRPIDPTAGPTIDPARADALWQRVRESLPLSFGAMSHREGAIALCCRELHRLGLHRPLLSRLYRQARERQRQLQSMARLEGEPDWATAQSPEACSIARIQRLMGLAAADYQCRHPVYGQVLEAFRQECAAAQRAVLRLV